MIDCAIFDMDGTLIDSEPLWRIAEIKAFKEVGLELTEKMLLKTMGMRCDEVVDFYFETQPWKNKTKKQVEIDILANVQELIEEKGEKMKGVDLALDFFTKKKIPIALASSSPLGIIQSVVDKLGIKRKFKVMCSAEFEEYGKPHPAVFISTANYMRVNPKNCIVFEDSVNGVISVKAAQMTCVAIPSKEDFLNEKFSIADKKLNDLGEITKIEELLTS